MLNKLTIVNAIPHRWAQRFEEQTRGTVLPPETQISIMASELSSGSSLQA